MGSQNTNLLNLPDIAKGSTPFHREMDLYHFYVYKHLRQLVCARILTLSVPLHGAY